MRRFALPELLAPRTISALFCVVMMVIAALSSQPAIETLFSSLDKVHFDIVSAFFAQPSQRKTAVVEIDDKTVGELGRHTIFLYPTHAQLVDRLSSASSLVFDLVLTAPGLQTASFAEAIHRNGRVVLTLLPSAVNPRELILPPPYALIKSAAAIGYRDIRVGHFGIAIGFVPFRAAGTTLYPHIVLAALQVAGERAARLMSVDSFAGAAMPQRARPILMMLPSAPSADRYSYIDVLKGRVPAAAFAGKIVFVGHSLSKSLNHFRISSLNRHAVSHAQLDAMMTEAVLDGNFASKVRAPFASAIYLLITAGMLLICAFKQGARMHMLALAWSSGTLMLSTVLLAWLHLWLPMGSMLATGMVIYLYFAWRRLADTHQLLQYEIAELSRISSTVGLTSALTPASVRAAAMNNPLAEIRFAMQQIRSWQQAYVNVINLLPYPVFLEKGGCIVLWNNKAVALLNQNQHAPPQSGNAAVSIPAIQELASSHRDKATDTGVEIKLAGREHLLLCVPFAPVESPATAESESNLICLIDITSIKEAVRRDRQVLRHMAHDLRNPLTTIVALIEARHGNSAARGDQPADDHFIGELSKQVNYSLRIAQDFIQLSRTEHLDPQTFVPLLLIDVVTEAIDQILLTAEQKSIKLIGPHCADEVFVLGDNDMLMRAITNVLDNAIKYSPAGTPITLLIERVLRDDSTTDHCERAVLRIIDEGIGIPSEALPHLFEPFFQVDHHRRHAANGVGLGLPFVKTVIERHGGSVEVTSQVGRGTHFRIVLPIAQIKVIIE